MRKILSSLILAAFLLIHGNAFAAHLVGSEIYYECINDSTYRVTIKVYRDCKQTTGAQSFDAQITVGIYYGNGSLFRFETVALSEENDVPVNVDYPCVDEPDVCIKQGIYRFTTQIPPSELGYDLVWHRCCRANDIVNIVNAGNVGMSVWAHIPAVEPNQPVCNNSPKFNADPPILICTDQDLEINSSASDPDGDSLVYELCAPFDGANTDPGAPVTNIPDPPPLNPVTFSAPYSATYPLPSSPPMNIDSLGIIRLKPTQAGRYVVGICVKEYRDGKLIATHLRDFHFQVLFCPRLAFVQPLPDTLVLCKPFTVNYQADATNAVSVFWDFGDPTTSNDTSSSFNPSYTYPAPGTYTVTLYALNAQGCGDTAYAKAVIRNAVRPDFDYIKVCPGEPVQFTSTSVSEAGNITRYAWKFGDGDTSDLANPLHQYTSGGSFTVSLEIFTDQGCSERILKLVTFHPRPVPNFNYQKVCLNQAVQFNNQSSISSGSIASYQWDFGDGSPTGSGSNPQHIYSDTGTYIIRMIAISDKGCIDSVSKSLYVKPYPVARVMSDTSTCKDKGIQLTASGGSSYQWMPANTLSQANIPNPIASPKVPTIYTVIVSDDCASDTASIAIGIYPDPVPDFSYVPKCANEPISFNDLSVSGIQSWKWEFPGGSVETSKNPVHTFNDNGPHQVILTVSNQFGCDSSISKEVIPFEVPDVKFQSIKPACLLKEAVFIDETLFARDSAVAWNWTFGDGSSASGDTSSHTYQSTGSFPVTLRVLSDKGCMDSLTKNYIIPKIVIGSASGDTTICVHDRARLQASGGIFYRWLPSASVSNDSIADPWAMPLENTVYTVLISDTCYLDTAYVAVNTYPIPDPFFEFDPACENEAIVFTENSQLSGDTVISWDWDFAGLGSASGNPVAFIFDSIGPFEVTLRVVNNFGCDTTVSRTVSPYPLPLADFAIDSIPCPYDDLPFRNLSSIVSGSIAGYQWDFGDGSTGSGQDPSHVYGVPDTYTVVLTAISDFGCEDTAVAVISFKPYVRASIAGDTTLCIGDTGELTASGGYFYEWSPASAGIFSPFDSVTKILPASSTTYSVRVSDECYSDSASISIVVKALPDFSITPDTSIYLGEQARLYIKAAPDVDSFIWFPASILAPGSDPHDSILFARPDSSTYVFIFVRNIDGCRGVDSLYITILDGFVAIPNAFSPNGDGLNDHFFLISRGSVTVNVFQIYNRWGELVYSYSGPGDQSSGWDGSFRGKAQDPGNYTYVYEVVTDDASKQVYRGKGSVQLIR